MKSLLWMLLALPFSAHAVNVGFPMAASESPSDGSLDTHKDDKNDQVRKPAKASPSPSKEAKQKKSK